MTGDDTQDDGAEKGVPDSDPRHIDPAGDLAEAFERGEIEVSDADTEDLREFVERAESGEFGAADPGLEAAVRIARALLDDEDGSG